MKEIIEKASKEIESMNDEEFESELENHQNGDIANAIMETSGEWDDLDKEFEIDSLRINEIKVKIHGLAPDHEKEAIKMIVDGVPLGEVADHFGIARSDIAYVNG